MTAQQPNSPSSPANSADRQRAVAAQIDWHTLEQIVHGDPAGRGLASFRRSGEVLDAGQLRAAALELAEHARSVAIVTGFCARGARGLTAETDGPPGALFLARALAALGVRVLLITDALALPLLKLGLELWQLDDVRLLEFPLEDNLAATDRFVAQLFQSVPGKELTHVISIERPGPSHTLESLRAQPRSGEVPTAGFEAEVDPADRDRCHNMRGLSIDHCTASTHRLFEWIAEHRLPVRTIGIGDGGNELGMGTFAWEVLVDAIARGPAGRIACRIATDYTLIAGVSNWAGYALALAVARLRGQENLGHRWNAAGQRELIQTLVERAGALDGLTLQPTVTVDGLEMNAYLQPLRALRQCLGYGDEP